MSAVDIGPGASLAIETSGYLTQCALLDLDGKVRSVSSGASGMHAEELGVLVERLVSQAACTWREIGSIVCGLGPGSFTGLRIGLAYAKGVSLVRRIPLFGVSSFDALALSAAEQTQRVVVLSDARRSEWFWCAYEVNQVQLSPRVELVSIGTLDQIQAECNGFWDMSPKECINWVVPAGEQRLDELSDWVTEHGLGLVRPVSEVAHALLQLVDRENRPAFGGVSELAAVAPQYVRAVAARTIRERQSL